MIQTNNLWKRAWFIHFGSNDTLRILKNKDKTKANQIFRRRGKLGSEELFENTLINDCNDLMHYLVQYWWLFRRKWSHKTGVLKIAQSRSELRKVKKEIIKREEKTRILRHLPRILMGFYVLYRPEKHKLEQGTIFSIQKSWKSVQRGEI